jgi:hypothetical protein
VEDRFVDTSSLLTLPAFVNMIVASSAIISSALVTQCLSSKRTELASEILSWVILPLLLRGTRSYKTNPESSLPSSQPSGSDRHSSWSLWIVAASLAATSLFRAELDSIGLFVSVR